MKDSLNITEKFGEKKFTNKNYSFEINSRTPESDFSVYL